MEHGNFIILKTLQPVRSVFTNPTLMIRNGAVLKFPGTGKCRDMVIRCSGMLPSHLKLIRPEFLMIIILSDRIVPLFQCLPIGRETRSFYAWMDLPRPLLFGRTGK